MELNRELVRNWLEILHGDSKGLLQVCSTANWAGHSCESIEEALSYVEFLELNRPQGIYLRATTIKDKLPPGKRGKASDSASLPGLWADIDIAGPGHRSEKPLPRNEGQATNIVAESGLPEPTLWIHSGGGLYPWWLLHEAVDLTGDEEYMQVAAQLIKNWQKILAFSAEQQGLHYGTEVGNLDRVLRIPGTVNRKIPEAPMLCQVVTDIGGTMYTFDQLVDSISSNMSKIEAVTPARNSTPKPTVPAPAAPPGHVSPGDAIEQLPWEHELLLADWQIHHVSDGITYWTRPGKSTRLGYSATTGKDANRDRLYVFTSETPLPAEEPLNKFGVYAWLHHGGNFSAAAAELRRLGYGTPASAQSELEEFVYEGVPIDRDGDEVAQSNGWSRYSWDDLGNAERFAARYSNQVMWVHNIGQWALYEEGSWRIVEESLVGTLAQELIKELPQLEAGLYDATPGEPDKRGKPGPSVQEQFLAWVAKQRSSVKLRSMVYQARSQRSLQGTRDMFDQHHMLLNCQNGVLDLTTGQLGPHDSSLHFTQKAHVNWEPDAECPLWEDYLRKTIPDPEERAYLQRIAGYSLTGDVSEQALFVHYGPFGNNGKSVFLEVMGALMGDYSIGVMASTLMSKPYEGNANEDVARMAGKRFMRTSETNVGRQLNEGQVKLLTGGDDVITARHLYQGSFDFRPTGKIHLATNHAPKVSNADSIWRRIHVIGWDVQISAEERDRHLSRKILNQERAGVLAWAVAGAIEWQRKGLAPPVSSQKRVETYREDQDVVGEFITDSIRETEEAVTPFSQIYRTYENWCQANGVKHPLSGPALSKALQERGYTRHRTKSAKCFKGITVLTALQQQVAFE